MSEPGASKAPRIVGVDVARALASLVMVQGHAYHAWVAEPFRDTPSYLFTRLLGTLPLPAFLLLAGVGLGLRARAAVRRSEPATHVRRGLVKRGLQVWAAGYVTNFAFAAIDGAEGATTLLRADVLHVIGLSIVCLALCGVRGDGAGHLRLPWLRGAALGLWLLPSALCPWLSPLGARVPAALAPLAALLVDVPGYTHMPLVPLVAWLALGALLGTSQRLLPLTPETPFAARAGTGGRRVLLLGVASAALALLAHLGTEWLVQLSGAPLSRAHPAVFLNVLDFACRGAVVLAAGLLLGGALPAHWGRWLTRLGQSSLWIYVAHLPFCYGRLGRGLHHALDMPTASLWLAPLLAFSVGVGLLRSRMRERTRRPAATALQLDSPR